MGTVKAQGHLRLFCAASNMLPLNRPELYVTGAADKFDESGELVDEATRQRIARPLGTLAQWIERLGEESHA